MAERIPLPKVVMRKDAKAHPFPCQIALHTRELMQGAVFWFICADEAAGEFIRLPNGLNMLKANLLKASMKEEEWECGWNCLNKYKNLFQNVVFQNVLIVIRSYWDWYITKLVEFIIFTRENTDNTLMAKNLKKLRRITHKEILEQISIVEQVCKLEFQVSEETKQRIKEMSLVRNLGLHNRWEVDQYYLDKTLEYKRWQTGDIRTFDSHELKLWHGSLINLISKTCKPVAIQNASAKAYPPEAGT